MPLIDRIETVTVDLPTIRGHVLSMTTMRVQTLVLVWVRFADGSVGIGEGTTIGGLSYGGESPESIRSAIEDYIAPALVGGEGDTVNACIARVEKAVRGNPIARAAVEMALWDGLARRLGVPVAQLFGGAVATALPVAWTLASGDRGTDIAEAEALLDARRHRDFKLKIGARGLEEDIAHVGAIKRALGDRASIRVDVNQAWSPSEARRGLAALAAIGVDLAEQPVDRAFPEAMAELTRAGHLAVMADESLQGPQDAMRLAAMGAADVFAVKVAQSGGLKRAAEVAAIARARGIGLYAGTMLESGVGTAAALQLFATLGRLEWGGELFGPLLMRDELLAQPLRYADFCVHLPEGAGTGVEIDPDKLAFYRRDRTRTLHAIPGGAL